MELCVSVCGTRVAFAHTHGLARSSGEKALPRVEKHRKRNNHARALAETERLSRF